MIVNKTELTPITFQRYVLNNKAMFCNCCSPRNAFTYGVSKRIPNVSFMVAKINTYNLFNSLFLFLVK